MIKRVFYISYEIIALYSSSVVDWRWGSLKRSWRKDHKNAQLSIFSIYKVVLDLLLIDLALWWGYRNSLNRKCRLNHLRMYENSII